MESLYLLVPMSVGLILMILGVFAWALHAGQFDELEQEGTRIFETDRPELDQAQGDAQRLREKSTTSNKTIDG